MVKKFTVLFSLFFALAACDAPQQSISHALIGQKFPVLNVQNLQGEDVSIQMESLEKPVLVNIWATWCSPCIREMPSLETLAAEGKVRVVALSHDTALAPVLKFTRTELYPNLEIYFEAFGKTSRRVLDMPGLPTSYLLDKNGVVRHVFKGEVNWQDEKIEAVLKKYK